MFRLFVHVQPRGTPDLELPITRFQDNMISVVMLYHAFNSIQVNVNHTVHGQQAAVTNHFITNNYCTCSTKRKSGYKLFSPRKYIDTKRIESFMKFHFSKWTQNVCLLIKTRARW